MAVCCSSPLMSAGASGRSYAAQGDLCVACGESCVGVCEESCAAVGCMEAAYRYERSSGPTTLAYVGTGGDYIQETTYKYIGGGAGDYGMVAMPKARSSNNVVCICCILPLLLSLGMGLLLLSVLMISNTTTTTTTTRTTSTSLPILVSTESAAEFMYDCSGNQEFWSKDKLAWCCIQEEIGCPTAPPPESGADLPPEIRAELPPEPSSVAPSTPPSTTAELDCDQCENGGCPAPERTRCCLRFGKACPTTPLTTLPPPPPPPPKPTPPPLPPPQPQPATPPPPPPTTASTTTPCPIDCNVGYNDLDPLQWVKGWSGEKKLYCCKTVGKGCPSELPPPSGLPPSGLPPEPDNTEYDCDAGYHHCMHCLVESWSPPKIDFCCKTQHKGCKGEEPP